MSFWQAVGLEFRDERLERKFERGIVIGRFPGWPVLLLLQAAVAAVLLWKRADRHFWIRLAISCVAEALYVLWRGVPRLRAAMANGERGDWVDTERRVGLLLWVALVMFMKMNGKELFGLGSTSYMVLLLVGIILPCGVTPLPLRVQMPILVAKAAIFFPHDKCMKYCHAVDELHDSRAMDAAWDFINQLSWFLLQAKHVFHRSEPRLEGTLAKCLHWTMFFRLAYLVVLSFYTIVVEIASRDNFLKTEMQSEEVHENMWSYRQVLKGFLLLLFFLATVVWQILLKVYSEGVPREC